MKTGYKITAPKEGDEETLDINVLGRNIEDALTWVRVALEEGRTKIIIIEEDRAIRDYRRDAGLSPDVECEGPVGFRCVKANTGADRRGV